MFVGVALLAFEAAVLGDQSIVALFKQLGGELNYATAAFDLGQVQRLVCIDQKSIERLPSTPYCTTPALKLTCVLAFCGV